jgi:hypothetical protein
MALYLGFPTADYSYDAIGYVSFIHQAAYVGAGPGFWHDYHILYMPLGLGTAKILLAMGFVPDILLLMQMVNVFFSGMALGLLFLIIRDETGSDLPAFAGAALVGFSHAFWYYATDPEVYPVCIFFLLLAFRYGRQLASGGRIKAGIQAGVATGLAVGFHVAAILILPVILMGTMLAPGKSYGGKRSKISRLVLYVAISLAVALIPYAVRFQADPDLSLLEGLADRFAYAAGQESAEGNRWLLGQGYSPLLQFAGVQNGLAVLPEKAGAVRVASFLLRWSLPLLLLAPLLLFPKLWKEDRICVATSGAWLIGFFAFFTAYNVGSIKFVPFQLIPAVILVCWALARLPGRAGRYAPAALLMAALVLGASNLSAAVRPGAAIENNAQFQLSRFIEENSSRKDLVIHLGIGENIKQKVYLPYFAARRELVLDLMLRMSEEAPGTVLARVESMLASRLEKGGRVLVFGEVLEESEAGRIFHAKYDLSPDYLNRLFRRFRPSLHAESEPLSFSLYLLVSPREPMN